MGSALYRNVSAWLIYTIRKILGSFGTHAGYAAGVSYIPWLGIQPRRSGLTPSTSQGTYAMNQQKALYTAKVHTIGGREGASRSSDGRLHVRLSSPGFKGEGTNPEQLFAAGWSACFEGAIGKAAEKMKVDLPPNLAIDAEVDLCQVDGDYFLQARLNVSVPGVERDVAQALVDTAHQTCPYSKATRGNIDVVINLV
jgi:Ohr subfamily peroxiredoxin